MDHNIEKKIKKKLFFENNDSVRARTQDEDRPNYFLKTFVIFI